MRVVVSPEKLDVVPGVPVVLSVSITNPGDVIGGYVVRLLGVDPSWVEMPAEDISLFPEESRTVNVTVTVPVGLAAGERRMAVQVRELTPPRSSAIEEVVLVVPEAPNVQVRVDPTMATGGRKGVFSLLVENRGNTRLQGWLAADDSENKLKYRFDPPRLDLGPGEHQVVDLGVKGSRPFLGSPLVRLVNLHLVDGEPPTPEPVEGESRLHRRGRVRAATAPPAPEGQPTANATFIQKALVSRGPLTLVGLLVALTVFAIVITLSFSKIVGQSAQDRDLALKIAAAGDGTGDDAGSSSIGGVVRMLTTGAPADGVAVNLFAADDLVHPLTSLATRDDGAYSFTGLPAGEYKVTFRGAGFVQLWYPQSLDPDNAETITLDENNRVEGVDVALGGVPASISGQVTGTDVSDATVTLQRPSAISSDSGAFAADPTSADTGAVVSSVPVGADGVFTLPDVPSPSVYDLVVTKEGYARTVQRVDVAAGEERKNVQLNLIKGNGAIRGTVYSDGAPLPEVTLTLTSGQTSATTLSLDEEGATDGDAVGSFTLRQLPTPATYTLVASRDGFASQTITVSLADGQQLEGVALTLGKASGALSGTTSLASGGKLGGVTVAISDGSTTIETATGSAGADLGAWEVSGLPVPGTYTVTFTRADVATQTISVVLDPNGAVSPGSTGTTVDASGAITTTLRASTGSLVGTVYQRNLDDVGRKAVGEVTVELSNGTSSYSVVTASLPAGDLGEYRLEQIPPGTYTVSVSRRGISPTSEIKQIVAGDPTPYNPVLRPASAIIGLVYTREDGERVGVGADYVVQLFRSSNFPSTVYKTTRTDGDGNYRFNDVDAPETYVIQVRRTNGGPPLATKNVQVDTSSEVNGDVRVPNDG